MGVIFSTRIVFVAESNLPVSVTWAAGKSLTISGFSTIQIPRSSSATKTARCGFHSRCPTEAPPRQHFRTQSARPGLVCWVPQLSSLIQPARVASFCWADTDPSPREPQRTQETRAIRTLIIIRSSVLFGLGCGGRHRRHVGFAHSFVERRQILR